MMFPNTSTYMHLFRQNGMRVPWDEDPNNPLNRMKEQERERERKQLSPGDNDDASFGMRPWESGHDTGTDTGEGGFRGFGSEDEFRSARRRSMGAGLTALGSQLLEAAPRGDYAGGLARGASAFSGAFGEERDRIRQEAREMVEERRHKAGDLRAEEQEMDRNRAADLNYDQGTQELEAFKEQQARGKQARERTGKSAEAMVAEIEALAATRPEDAKLQAMAKRAVGYSLGEESDLNKLADLHEQMTGQTYRQDDFDWKAQADRDAQRKDIEAGVASDPRAAERRANESLAISRSHLGIAQERAGQEKEGLTDLQAYDRLEKKIKEKIESKIAAHKAKFFKHPQPEVEAQMRQAAINEAMAEMQSGINRVYRFTENGQLIPGD